MQVRYSMKVRDAMTRFPATCTPDTTLAAAAQLMASADCGAIPVIGEDHEMPIGVITDRDMVLRAFAQGLGPSTLVRDCMTSPAITITEHASLDDCIALLERKQIRRVVVIGSDGRCIGIVAQADIAEHASQPKAGELLQYISKQLPADVSTSGKRH
jgi:CBS domain-containing protein